MNNLCEGIGKIKYKYGRDNKKCETCRIEYKYSGCFLKYTSFKNDLIEYKYLYCNKSYKEKFNEMFY